MASILQMTFSNVFCWIKKKWYWLIFVTQGLIDDKSAGNITTVKKKSKIQKVNSALNDELYQSYKRKLQQLIKVVEKHHYHDLLIKYSNNMKKSWGVIKSIINKNQKTHIQGRFKIGKKLITSDNELISNKFNDFFINIGPTLAKSIPRINKRPVGLSSFVNCPPVVSSFLTQRQLSVIVGWQHMGRVPHAYYINPGYGLSLVDTLWNASSYWQPLEQEGYPMTWIEKFWLQISLIVAKK